MVVRFLGQLAVELFVLHLTTALVHRLVRYAASEFLPGAKCCRSPGLQEPARCVVSCFSCHHLL